MRFLPVNPDAKSTWTRLPVRVYGTAAVLLGVLVASYVFIVVPKNKAMASARAEIRNRETTLQLFQVELARLEGSRRRLDQLSRALSSFDERLPQQGEIDVLLREVWVVADASGLKTQRIKTLRQKEFEGYKAQPIEMSLRGPFSGVHAFMVALERMPGMMKIESMKIGTAPGETGGIVDASLVLNVFCKP